MDARMNARKQMGSETIGALLKTCTSASDRKGSKDHARANYEHIKAVQAKQRAKKQEENKAPPAPFKLAEFAQAESKVKQAISGEVTKRDFKRRSFFASGPTVNNCSSTAAGNCSYAAGFEQFTGSPVTSGTNSPTLAKKEFLKAHSRKDLTPSKDELFEPKEDAIAKVDTGRRVGGMATPGAPVARSKNFINQNYTSARSASHRSLSIKSDQKKNSLQQVERSTRIGELPQYLIHRKAEWADELQKKEAEKTKIRPPPGTTLLADEERLETLRFLEKSHSELTSNLARLPLTSGTTVSSRRRKDEMVQKLEEIEKAMKIYRRDRVFMAIE